MELKKNTNLKNKLEEKKYSGNKLTATHSFTVFPNDLNYAGSLFGGKVMAEMDLSGVKVVRRALYETGADGCVTASVDKIDFKKPAQVGDIISMNSEIKALGKSSLQVKINVSRESVVGVVEDICSANFTFVAIKDGKPYHHNLNFEKITS